MQAIDTIILVVFFWQPLEAYRGYSSFKFIPGTRDSMIVATKSEENKGRIASCIPPLHSSVYSTVLYCMVGNFHRVKVPKICTKTVWFTLTF